MDAARRQRKNLDAVDVLLPGDLDDDVGGYDTCASLRHEGVCTVRHVLELEVAAGISRRGVGPRREVRRRINRRHRVRRDGVRRHEREGDPLQRLMGARVEEPAGDARHGIAVAHVERRVVDVVAVPVDAPAQVETRRHIRHVASGGRPLVKFYVIPLERLELERQTPGVARLQDACRMRRTDACNQHRIGGENIGIILSEKRPRVCFSVSGVSYLFTADHKHRRVHLRVALVLVNDIARVHAVVARALRQLQLGFEDRPLRHLVYADYLPHRYASRLNVVVAVGRDVLHVKDGKHVCGI